MKKISLITFLLFCGFVAIAQQNLARVADNFFRINPFEQPYNKFFTALVDDPMISGRIMKKRTDTSLFSFTALYKDYSPYTSFKADRTEIRLMEKEVDVGDSLELIDTVLVYQLIGYKYGADGLEDIKKEFNKFNRRFKNDFFTDQHSDLLKNEEVVGGMINYFVLTCNTSPLNASWWKAGEAESAFSITFRFKIKENLAILPIPPDPGQ